MIMVTHDPALAARANRVITLRAGRVVSDEATPR
jgi:predicted ABC-type transport system involved in lysophospholipase L1 biosynthesis ATPase subunit